MLLQITDYADYCIAMLIISSVIIELLFYWVTFFPHVYLLQLSLDLLTLFQWAGWQLPAVMSISNNKTNLNRFEYIVDQNIKWNWWCSNRIIQINIFIMLVFKGIDSYSKVSKSCNLINLPKTNASLNVSPLC